MGKLIALKSKPSAHARFETLIEPHFDALYKAARRMTMSQHDAEDLVQEVCIKAFDRIGELEQIEFPRAWLLKIMYHRFIDDRRRAARSPADIASTGETSRDPSDITSDLDQPHELVEREQRIEQLLRAMHCLSGDQCALLAMHDIEGLSINELCQLTDMPAGTIKAQLHRTRVKLGRLLKNDAVTRPQLKVIGGRQ